MDIYKQVTNTIIELIEKGADDFVMPWHYQIAIATNAATTNKYQGTNALLLWAATQKKLFESNVWGTFLQWKTKGGTIKKGEKATKIVFFKKFSNLVVDDNDEEDNAKNGRCVVRFSNVFNASQVAGVDIKDFKPENEQAETNENISDLIGHTGAAIKHGGHRACYSPSGDIITIPSPSRFFATGEITQTEAYHSTLFHELVHWTGHPSRCNRQLVTRFGTEAYAMEELVAELGAAFLCARFGFNAGAIKSNAAYLDNWLVVLKRDKKAIFYASGQATKAADFIFNLRPLDEKLNTRENIKIN